MSATVFSRYCGTLTCNASAVVRVIVSPRPTCRLKQINTAGRICRQNRVSTPI
jgi:hypothetical protein